MSDYRHWLYCKKAESSGNVLGKEEGEDVHSRWTLCICKERHILWVLSNYFKHAGEFNL